jgi:hypothetical protein
MKAYGVIFSVREAKQYYDQAFADAWAAILEKLQSYKQEMKGSDFRLERVDYDADSYISKIDELPDEPKAPSQNLLDVKVGVEALYRVIQ